MRRGDQDLQGGDRSVRALELVPFFGHYFKRYIPWVVAAALSILVFAAATGALIVLIEPIFGEVLLAGDQLPAQVGLVTGSGSGSAGGGDDGRGDDGRGDDVAADDGGEETPPEERSALDRFLARFELKAQLTAGYEELKRRFGIGPQEVVYFVPVLFICVFLLRSLFAFVSGYAFQVIGLGITTDVRNDLYRRILDQSSRFYALHPSGELVTRVVSDVSLMQNAVSNRLLDLFQQSFTLIVLVVLLLSTNFKLAVLCLVATPMVLIPIVRFGKGMRRTSHRSQERLADLTALLTEGVRGHRVVKAFGMEGFEHDRFKEATGRHLKVNLWAQLLANLSSPVVESLSVVGAAALLVYAGNAIRAGELTPATLIAFLTNLIVMYDPIRKLNKVNLILQQALAAAQRVASVMKLESEVEDAPDAEPIATIEEGIGYREVSFSYEDDEAQVLRQVELSIRRGEIVALVGPSGAGKSTLVNLLPRFFDPDAGRVTIDGRDIRHLRLADLRSLIGIVTQETVLFDDTIRNNIAYGRADLPLEQVEQAAQAAYAEEFIETLPNGYDSRVGESGLRLSGGQRQRLAIARALLKNAPILILDEATSQLDSESEALVQKALYNLMQGRTTLVIAHRLATVMKADRIVVMEGGRIVEQGSHDQLIAEGGLYKRLYDLQFAG